MRVGVTERAETVIVLLSGRIPQGKLNVLSVDFDIGHIVLEHGGNINLAGGKSDGIPNSDTARGLRRKRAMHVLRIRLIKLGRTSGKVPFEKTINKQV
jgi:hypothetical protein